MQPQRRRKIGHDGAELPSVPLAAIVSLNLLDVQDGLFAQMRERGGETTPERTPYDLYRGVNRDTVTQGGSLAGISDQAGRIAGENQPSAAAMAAAPLRLESILAIRHNATHPSAAAEPSAQSPDKIATAPEFHSKLDRESFPVQLFDIIESLVCVQGQAASTWHCNLADLLAHENCVFLSEAAAYTARRRDYIKFEQNSASRRNLSAPMSEWRGRWIGPFGGGQPIIAQDYILFDESDETKKAARALPPLPQRLLCMYADGPPVCDIYRVDESFYAMCFYRPCATTPGHHQYMGCFYTQSEQSVDRDLSGHSHAAGHTQ